MDEIKAAAKTQVEKTKKDQADKKAASGGMDLAEQMAEKVRVEKELKK